MTEELRFLIFIGFIVLCLALAARLLRRHSEQKDVEQLKALGDQIATIVVRDFDVTPCPRCLEDQIDILKFGPSFKSVYYKCVNCGKARWAPTHTKQESTVYVQLAAVGKFFEEKYGIKVGRDADMTITTDIPDSPITVHGLIRMPIPENVRREVWRRDGGQCVKCGSKENLEYDHIIPFSRGGASTARNLQLLCSRCNREKSDSI